MILVIQRHLNRDIARRRVDRGIDRRDLAHEDTFRERIRANARLQALREIRKILLRNGEIDKQRVECL